MGGVRRVVVISAIAVGMVSSFAPPARAHVVCTEIPIPVADDVVIVAVCFDGTTFQSASVRTRGDSGEVIVSVTQDHALNHTTVCVSTEITTPNPICVTIPVS